MTERCDRNESAIKNAFTFVIRVKAQLQSFFFQKTKLWVNYVTFDEETLKQKSLVLSFFSQNILKKLEKSIKYEYFELLNFLNNFEAFQSLIFKAFIEI